jgi:hypothetical protein
MVCTSSYKQVRYRIKTTPFWGWFCKSSENFGFYQIARRYVRNLLLRTALSLNCPKRFLRLVSTACRNFVLSFWRAPFADSRVDVLLRGTLQRVFEQGWKFDQTERLSVLRRYETLKPMCSTAYTVTIMELVSVTNKQIYSLFRECFSFAGTISVNRVSLSSDSSCSGSYRRNTYRYKNLTVISLISESYFWRRVGPCTSRHK